MRKILQLAALFLLLVGLPAGSWYYLQKGLDYRLETIGQLADHGDFKLLTAGASSATEYVRVINFLANERGQREKQGELLSKLYAQFGKREAFQLITFWDSTAFAELDTFRRTHGLEEEPQCTFGPLSQQEWQQFVTTYKEGAKQAAQQIALVDIDGNIRNFYAQDQEAEIKRLVEHIALLLPIEKKAKPELRREIEK